MSWKLSSCFIVAVLAVVLVSGCKKSSTSSSDLEVEEFATGLTGTDGSSGTRISGSPPAGSGGPAVTASSTGTTGTAATVIAGGSNLVRLRAGSPFQTVYLQVTASPVAGYYRLNLNSPQTDTFVIVSFGRDIPEPTFQTIFSVGAASGGAVGASSSIVNTVNAVGASGNVQVQASWDVDSDLDLHVIEPSGREIYFVDPGPTATGGFLDVDSICGSAGNVENIRWETNAPNGTYIVRLENYSSCGQGQSNYVVTVNNGGSTNVYSGMFTDTGSGGGAGAGRSITTFVHSSSSLTTQGGPPAGPQPLSPAAIAKRAAALAGVNRVP